MCALYDWSKPLYCAFFGGHFNLPFPNDYKSAQPKPRSACLVPVLLVAGLVCIISYPVYSVIIGLWMMDDLIMTNVW